MRKIIKAIIAISIVIVMSGCTISVDTSMFEEEPDENLARIEYIEENLAESYIGEFILLNDEPIVSEQENTTYGYKYITDDVYQIEFMVYYWEGKIDTPWGGMPFSRTSHFSCKLDYAIAEYVVNNSEFSGDDYEITYESLGDTVEDLYALAVSEEEILAEYGRTWFSPLLNVYLVYKDETFDVSFRHADGKEVIYRGLKRTLNEMDEKR